MANEKDDNADNTEKPAPKRVVVTYGSKKKKEPDLPPEIMPHAPSEILSSPVEIPSSVEEAPRTRIRGHVLSGITPTSTTTQESIQPPPSYEPTSSVAAPVNPYIGEPAAVSPSPLFTREKKLNTQASVPFDTAESKEEHYAQEDRLFTPPPPPPPPPPQVVRQAGGSSNAALFLSLVATISTIGLIFFAYYSQQQLTALEKATYGEQASVQALVGEAKTAFNELDALKSQHHRQHSALQNLQSELTHAQNKLITLLGDRGWVISEAGFLISLANQRLHMAQDMSTAVAALQTADERLATLGDPSVTQLRAALTQDINALIHAKNVDRQGIWQQLTVLQQSLSLLKYQTGLSYTSVPAQQEEISSHLPVWQQALRKSWKELKSFIQITKLENNPIHPVLNEQMQAELLRTLILQIEQIQWAVLHGENGIYLHNLQNLQKYITEYFVANEAQNVILKTLQQLAAISIEFPKLEINETLKAWSALPHTLPTLSPVRGKE